MRTRGHDCEHVLDLHLDEADDRTIWDFCIRENRVLISKDLDFTFLANRPGDTGRLIWVRLGNCRKDALIRSIGGAHDAVIAAFDGGQRIVEVH